jgi:hypothetical protein
MIDTRYGWLGWGLLLAGIVILPTSYLLLHSIPIIALGISVIIIGIICLVLGKTRPVISPELSKLLMDTGVENLGSLLEELGLKARGMYLPSSLCGGKPKVIIPLHCNQYYPNITKPLTQRLVVSFGEDPEDIGILVSTIGSNILDTLDKKPGASIEEITTAITTLLVGTLDVADGAKVSIGDSRAIVRISNPRLRESSNSWAVQSLGSSAASIAASIVAEALEKAVIIESETYTHQENIITLEIIDNLQKE